MEKRNFLSSHFCSYCRNDTCIVCIRRLRRNCFFTWKTTENLEISTDFHGFDGSFVLYDSQTGLWKIYRPELAVQRFSPASTFKIYSALHGLEKGIISPESSSMKWDGTLCAFPRWEQDQTLDSAMKDSVNWYFQNIDQLLGRTEISSFLKKSIMETSR